MTGNDPRKDPPNSDDIQQVKELFGKSLKAQRKRQGLSRIELATDAGVSDESLARIERGEGNPEFATLIRIALAMEMSLTQLFGWMGQGEGDTWQLTVHERDIAVNGLLLVLGALTGTPSGELTERGIRRSASPPAVINVRYAAPQTSRRQRRPSKASRSRQTPQPRKGRKARKTATSRKSHKPRKARKRGRKH